MANTLYDRLIIEIFNRHDGANQDEFSFARSELTEVLQEWGESVRNLGDVIYTYRGGRRKLPTEILSTGNWVIEGGGKGQYILKKLGRNPYIEVPTDLQRINILDATPDIILKYGGGDEQGLLAKVRYNRLIDTFLSITAYHLQSHMRGFITNIGQIEIDDLYVAVDTNGNQFMIPIEAKTAHEPLGLNQVVSLNRYARENFPELTTRSVAVKSWTDDTIFFMEFNATTDTNKVEVVKYKRYRLIRDETVAKQLGIEVED